MKVGDVRRKWRSIKEKYQALPAAKAPDSVIDIPTNPDDLRDDELDRCILSYGAWRGYVSSKLAEVSAQLSLVESAYSIGLGNIMAEMERTAKKKLLKESLIGNAVANNDFLQELQNEMSDLRAEKQLLDGKFNFFNGQFETISRVITRRSWERMRNV